MSIDDIAAEVGAHLSEHLAVEQMLEPNAGSHVTLVEAVRFRPPASLEKPRDVMGAHLAILLL